MVRREQQEDRIRRERGDLRRLLDLMEGPRRGLSCTRMRERLRILDLQKRQRVMLCKYSFSEQSLTRYAY